jgi:hypothetical protein
MTRARYDAYRQLVSSLELAGFTAPEREILCDAAEGFLLARSFRCAELEELSLNVSVTLAAVVESGRMSRWAAEQARAWIDACGPTSPERLPALA